MMLPRFAPPALLTLLFALAVLLPSAAAQLAWKKVDVNGSYKPRGEAAFAQCGPKILCLLGGRGPGTVNILDTETLTWTAGKSPPLEIHHVQAVYGPDQCVWFVGAWTGPYPAERNIDNIWRYCHAQNTWFDGPEIPRARGGGGTVVYKNKIYIVSGNVGGHNTDATLVPWFDCYDPATGAWTTLPDVPHPRDHFHATVVGDKLYVVGGRDSTAVNFFNAVTPEVDVFDFTTNSWSSLPDFARPHGGSSTVTFQNTVWVLGGEGGGQAHADVDALEGGTFRPQADMADPRHGTGVVACSGALWIAGGADRQGGGSNARDTYAYFSGVVPPVCEAPKTPSDTGSQTPVAATPSSSSSAGMSPAAPKKPAVTPASSPAASTASTPVVPTITPPPPTPSATESDSSAATAVPPSALSSASPSASPSILTIDPSPENSPDADLSPSQEATDPSASPDCFPAAATVELENGSVKTMAELTVGDRVKVAHPATFSDVFFFSHDHVTARGAAVRLETDAAGATLTLSPGHLVRANAHLKPAHAVRVGDTLSVLGGPARVTATQRVVVTGKHNPHTLHGDIIVDGVVASTYTAAVHPVVARALLLPFRMMYQAAGAHDVVLGANRAVLQVLGRVYWR